MSFEPCINFVWAESESLADLYKRQIAPVDELVCGATSNPEVVADFVNRPQAISWENFGGRWWLMFSHIRTITEDDE